MIRAATAGDLSRIAEILVFGKRKAYRELFHDDRGSFVELQVLDVAEQYRADPRLMAQTLVLEDGGVVKGVLRAQLAPQTAELCELYVEPFFTGQGVGGALMHAFLEKARSTGAQKAALWVIEQNPGARRFYESFGFAATGEGRFVENTSVWELRYARALENKGENDMELHLATEKEVEALTGLSKAAFDTDVLVGGTEPGGPPDYDSVPWHRRMLRQGNLYSIVASGALAGGMLLFRDPRAPGIVYVGRVFIDPALHRTGLGLEAMRRLETLFEGAHTFRLETPVWNERTQRFYPKAGYREMKRDAESVYYEKRKA